MWFGIILTALLNYVSHHDICPLPNGNVLLIAYERRTAAETTAMGGSSAIEMWPDKIVEIKPTGSTTGDIVWEWKAWDHMQQSSCASSLLLVIVYVQRSELKEQ